MLDFLWQAKMPMRNSDPRRCLKSAASLLASLLLSGCISASPRAMYELSKFDPFTADPRGIAVAVQTDRNLRLRTGDVILQVAPTLRATSGLKAARGPPRPPENQQVRAR